MLCVSVLSELWLISQQILTLHDQNISIFDSLVQLFFGALLAISMVLAIWLENCTLLLPYLLMQSVGLCAFLTIFLALIYIVVLDRDLETIEFLIDRYAPISLDEGMSDGYKGLCLCLACFSLLMLQFWFLSIVIACWRYFRDKQTSIIQNNRVNTCIILHPINQIDVGNFNYN
uniref:MARVEL domain-containing protein n=1 Tax=Meloidogyne hapla TaxID=6305 RepID=A0A1I8BKZ3_MELHA